MLMGALAVRPATAACACNWSAVWVDLHVSAAVLDLLLLSAVQSMRLSR